jgi:hypothetical protein
VPGLRRCPRSPRAGWSHHPRGGGVTRSGDRPGRTACDSSTCGPADETAAAPGSPVSTAGEAPRRRDNRARSTRTSGAGRRRYGAPDAMTARPPRGLHRGDTEAVHAAAKSKRNGTVACLACPAEPTTGDTQSTPKNKSAASAGRRSLQPGGGIWRASRKKREDAQSTPRVSVGKAEPPWKCPPPHSPLVA